MADEVIIVAANPTWPGLFEQEKLRLLNALRSGFVAIKHFGSTAVSGLAAKPVINILGGVRSMKDADTLLGPLCALGYETSAEFNATLADRRFRRRRAGDVRAHHLHLVVFGGKQWQHQLRFHDCLRADPGLAQEYEMLKFDLADPFRANREAYTKAKYEFIIKALAARKLGS